MWWDQTDLVIRPRFAVDDQVVVLPDRRDGTVRRRNFGAGTWIYGVII